MTGSFVTTTATVTVIENGALKRDAVPVPPVLQAYVGPELTSACKCLNIPTKTTRITTTAPTPVCTPRKTWRHGY
jgi:hypothetical protein